MIYSLAKPSKRGPAQQTMSGGLAQSTKGGTKKGEGKKGKTAKRQTSSIAVLSKWKQNADGSITGFVKNKKGFKDGTQITTSSVKKGAKAGEVVKTTGGSSYQLS